MFIQQFEDKGLSHYSYVVLSEGEAALIDPSRDPRPYYDFVRRHDCRIAAVLETHSHADFVSSHKEIAEATGAVVCTSEFMKTAFPNKPLRDGDEIRAGNIAFRALYTPGHSYDSLCYLLIDPRGREHALFSGDTLFIGDVGRPDLRESVREQSAGREELARAMYRTLREKLEPLRDDILLYPAHGAGTLCGKSLSDANSSTMGAEKIGSPPFQVKSEEEFVRELLGEQPFVPKYFSYNVALNCQGAPALEEALQKVPRLKELPRSSAGTLVVDARPKEQFRAGHLKGALNIQDGLKFETWLGSIVGPDERYYLLAADNAQLEALLLKTAKIGYEANLAGAVAGAAASAAGDGPAAGLGDLAAEPGGLVRSAGSPPPDFDHAPEKYVIVDARNPSEYAQGRYFPQAVNIPLPELRERAAEIPPGKPVVVHCAAGYRSAIAASILESALPQKVYDMGNAIERKQHGSS